MAKQREMSEDNIMVVKLANHKVPEFKEVKSKEWVLYGEKDDYPQYLLELFNRSAKHNAIVTGKVHYIKGNGFEIIEEGLTVGEIAAIQDFIKNLNEEDSLDDILYKVANDLEIFSGMALQSIPNKTKTKTAQLSHIDFSRIRASKEKNKLWYSKGFGKKEDYNNEKEAIIELKPFDKNTKEGVIYFTQYRPGINDYPLPEYIGAIPYIETDYEISNFHLNNVKNGFSAGTMISFNNGVPETKEAQKAIEKKVIDKTTGSDKAGQVIITFSNGKDSAPTIIPLMPNNFDKLFDTLNQTVQQEIFTGHKITSPMLFGIKTEGQLGGRGELRDAFELLQNGYISAKQRMIEDLFNWIFEVNGFGKPLKIKPTEPISYEIPEGLLSTVLTEDEIRAKAGLGPKVKPTELSKFHSEDIFSKYGQSKQNFRIIRSSEIKDKEEAITKEIAFYKHDKFDALTDQAAILSMVSNDPIITTAAISLALGISLEKVSGYLADMLEKGFISKGEGKISINPEGKKIIDENPPKETLLVMYSYEVRKGVGAEVIPTTRPLCKKLIELDKIYTRQEIDQISKEVGFDVWTKRGGFYHDPKTDTTSPFCRHIWNQNIVAKNG